MERFTRLTRRNSCLYSYLWLDALADEKGGRFFRDRLLVTSRARYYRNQSQKERERKEKQRR